MALTQEQLTERRKYGEWLSYQLSELGISCDALAAAAGLNGRTVRRYACGESMPSPEVRAEIDMYVRSMSEYNDFKHIPSEIFAMLLEKLLKEFKGVITQEQLAERIGKRQKNISLYTCCAERPDTKVQYDILREFYRLCKPGGGISTAHFGTAAYLESLLYGENDLYYHGDDEPEIGEQATRKAVDFIISMPMRMQSFLLDNFGAFYDHTFTVESGFRYQPSFKYMSYGIELFRQLSEKEKHTLVTALEKYAVPEYPETNEQWAFFSHITNYRNVITADIKKLKSDSAMLNGTKEHAAIRQHIESLLNHSLAGDDEFVQEVSFKLSMTSREWYVWMLFLMYEYAGNNIFLLCNDMINIIHDPSRSTL